MKEILQPFIPYAPWLLLGLILWAIVYNLLPAVACRFDSRLASAFYKRQPELDYSWLSRLPSPWVESLSQRLLTALALILPVSGWTALLARGTGCRRSIGLTWFTVGIWLTARRTIAVARCITAWFTACLGVPVITWLFPARLTGFARLTCFTRFAIVGPGLAWLRTLRTLDRTCSRLARIGRSFTPCRVPGRIRRAKMPEIAFAVAWST